MNERLNALVGAKIGEFRRKMAEVNKSLASIPRNVKTEVDVRVDNFNRKIDNLASRIRNLGVVAGSAFKGGLLSILPSLSPIIASLAGGVGGLASSFTALGGAGGAFGVAAVGNATALAESMDEVQKINDKIKSERQALDPNQERINELLHEREHIMNEMSDAQKSAMKQVNKFKDAWSDFIQATQEPVFNVFAKGLQLATSLLEKMEPIVKPASQAIANLLEQFNKFTGTKQFQSFIEFFATRGVSAIENWGQIVGNIFVGFMEMMKAFGPLGKDMENGLIGMTKRFAEWAAGLSKSKSFQNFVNFVKTNGPKVLDLIGNLTTFIIELGKGMAPLGSSILDIINSFLSWSNEMMKSNPLIAKAVGWVLSLSGVLLAATPFIILLKSAFGGMVGFIIRKTAMMRAKLVTGISMMIKSLGKFIVKTVTTVARFVAQSIIFIARWSLMGVKALLHAGKIAAAWTLATGKKMAMAIASMVVTSAKFIARWALIGAKSLLHAAKVAASWVIAMGPVGWVIATVVGLVALIIANWDKVKKWTKKAWKATVDFVTEAWDTVWGKTKEIASAIWGWVKKKFNQTKDAISNAMSDAKTKIVNIWDSIKSIWNRTLGVLWDKVKEIFGNVVESVSGKIEDTKELVSKGVEKIKDFFDIDLFESGKAMINSVKDGVMSAKDAVVDKVKSVAGSIRDLWPFSPAKEGPLSDIHKMDFSGPIGKSINKAKKPIQSSMVNLANQARNSFAPDLAMANMSVAGSVDASISSRDIGAVEAGLNSDINDFELPQQDEQYAVMNIGGHEARGVISYISNEQEREQRRRDQFR